ncbi:MAG: tRNA 2-thiocytidine(32) synthetase TtcA [Clostridia bacterium]|nr:tRNA 2-thiocytidine(32) synthetase TtcA [Clostridia bacterium]
MNELQRILSFVRRAVDDYQMISDGDKIAVGISGGKDSLTLLVSLAALRRFYPAHFDLVALTVDMGFDGVDLSPIAEFCHALDVPFIVEKTDIAKVIFDIRRETNPCSLCAKMRRGALHARAKAEGCNKVALGHHFDDAVETFMLNLFHEGRLGCFSPVTYLSRRDLTLIRPLLYAQEKDVRYYTKRADPPLPLMKSPCPEDGETERETMKVMLRDLERKYPGLRHRIFGALCKGGIDGFKETERLPLMKDEEEND